MPTNADWKTDEQMAVGKGATRQKFVAVVEGNNLEIEVAPWGEGHLKVNGVEFAAIEGRKSRLQAFCDLKKIAEDYLALERAAVTRARAIDRPSHRHASTFYGDGRVDRRRRVP